MTKDNNKLWIGMMGLLICGAIALDLFIEKYATTIIDYIFLSIFAFMILTALLVNIFSKDTEGKKIYNLSALIILINTLPVYLLSFIMDKIELPSPAILSIIVIGSMLYAITMIVVDIVAIIWAVRYFRKKFGDMTN